MTQKEKTRLLLGATLHVLDTLTEDEAERLYSELYDAAEKTAVDPFNFCGESLRDLCGGEVISITPAGCEEAIAILIFTEDRSLVEVEGWANIYTERLEDARFVITRTDVIKNGTLIHTKHRKMLRGWLCHVQMPYFGRLFSTSGAISTQKGTRCRFFFLQRALFQRVIL